MEPRNTFQPVEVLTDGGDHDGRLVLVDGRLAAVLIRLSDPAYDENMRGSWYLEAGFSAALEMRHDLFATLAEAKETIAVALAAPPSDAAKRGTTKIT